MLHSLTYTCNNRIEPIAIKLRGSQRWQTQTAPSPSHKNWACASQRWISIHFNCNFIIYKLQIRETYMIFKVKLSIFPSQAHKCTRMNKFLRTHNFLSCFINISIFYTQLPMLSITTNTFQLALVTFSITWTRLTEICKLSKLFQM